MAVIVSIIMCTIKPGVAITVTVHLGTVTIKPRYMCLIRSFSYNSTRHRLDIIHGKSKTVASLVLFGLKLVFENVVQSRIRDINNLFRVRN